MKKDYLIILQKKNHIFNYDSNENKYNKNIIGRIFKFNRIKNTMNILYENSEKKRKIMVIL